MTLTCPLCATPKAPLLCEGKTPLRSYFRCTVCWLTFVPPESFLPAEEEQSRYEQHENQLDDPQYRKYLLPVFNAIAPHVRPGGSGLDYGCGPGPALVEMFREAGYPTEGFDPFFANHPEFLVRTYDFITCTEAAEHFHDPAKDFALLQKILNPGGRIAVLTQTWTENTVFSEWYYIRDPTHVVFFHETTFRWLADKYGWRLTVAGKHLFVLERPR